MRTAVRFCLLGVCLLAGSARAAQPVAYVLAPILAADTLQAIGITMSFEGESDGETILALPDEWGGEESLWRGLSAFQVQPPSARLSAGADSAHLAIRHAPGDRLTVSYRVHQDWPGEPAAGEDNSYRPVVQPGYFHLIGHAIFAVPEWSPESPARFRMPVLPESWEF
ncbi:MAG: trypsin-like serine protease, partial [bacterium]